MVVTKHHAPSFFFFFFQQHFSIRCGNCSPFYVIAFKLSFQDILLDSPEKLLFSKEIKLGCLTEIIV